VTGYEERILNDLKGGRHVALTGRLNELNALFAEIDLPAGEVYITGTFRRDPAPLTSGTDTDLTAVAGDMIP
jgi:hypothetical protein